MKNIMNLAVGGMLLASCQPSARDTNTGNVLEEYRPAYHFSPKKGWMNDPNGLVFLNGTYHLFFQHNPDSTVWGPMHWGHATSTDLVHWDEQPIALYPDSMGTIFSGSAVVDRDNTAGFGENALIAIFTQHSHEIEKEKTGLHQTQGIAYSLDEGRTWTKYEGNPVLPNPGIWDFRDPKVSWHEESRQWVMALATQQTITFYGSKNLKQWDRLSAFGEGIGAHGGVWECPDLLRFSTEEGDKWVLFVSINPGGPNTGSATQYFVGDFDGKTFRTDQKDIRWIDYGPDNYAGVTFSDMGDRRTMIAWMSNWMYANVVPASTWRSGNTIVRDLDLVKSEGAWVLTSNPVAELADATDEGQEAGPGDEIALAANTLDVSFTSQKMAGFEVELANASGDVLLFGYEPAGDQYYIDRSKAGEVSFSKRFVQRPVAPRQAKGDILPVRFLLDRNSIEIFADGGKTAMSALFFIKEPFTTMTVDSDRPATLKDLVVRTVN